MSTLKHSVSAAVILSAAFSFQCLAVDFSAKAGIETHMFNHSPLYQGQDRHSASVFISPQVSHELERGDIVSFEAHARLDATDKDRTHTDIRELSYLTLPESGLWEFKAGISKEFWGLAEGQNLVNVINQNDNVEGINTDEKLGQPMFKLTLLDSPLFLPDQDWGTLDLFVLPYFRKANFPGKSGRFRPPLPISNTRAMFESGKKESHIDYAARWSHNIGLLDIGLSYFKGTQRTPSYFVDFETNLTNVPITLASPSPEIVPFYAQLEQIGLEAQLNFDGYLFKLEAVHRDTKNNRFMNTRTQQPFSNQDVQTCVDRLGINCALGNQLSKERYTAYTIGGEYTFGNIGQTGIDTTAIIEYNHDSRDAKWVLVPLQNDVLIGARIATNNASSTTATLGLIKDLDHHSLVANAELTTRLSNRLSTKLKYQNFIEKDNGRDPLLSQVRQDDYTQVTLEYYF